MLVFAFACDPHRGSEPGAGAAIAKAAALVGDVTVLTRAEPGRDPAVDIPAACGVTRAVAIPSRAWEARLPVHVRYAAWCVRAAAWRRAHRTGSDYQVLHHATYASDWFLNPLMLLRKAPGEQWVAGPGGGATYPSVAIARAAAGGGVATLASELVRRWSTRASRRLMAARLRRRVDHALALNPDSRAELSRLGFPRVSVTSNAVIDYAALPLREDHRPGSAPRVLFMGRGTRWKGLPLLLRAAAHLPPDTVIDIAGPGTDASAYRDAAAALTHLRTPVTFHGSLPRDRALALLAATDALAFGSLHDSAPWAAAEAAALGVPVVCLDLGGVAMMAGEAARVVSTADADSLPRRFAEALVAAAAEDPSDRPRPTREFTLGALAETLGAAYMGAPVASPGIVRLRREG
ncbi:glycosyltransferase [Demequina sediminis]|uniref:glycosyltransferase n=1 Tax=Demequina sediminis TaxID=1930058 RepID=UPI002572CACF|nr:glycosyltransferase [Demequina sediminis]